MTDHETDYCYCRVDRTARLNCTTTFSLPAARPCWHRRAASRWIEIDLILSEAHGLGEQDLQILKTVGILNLVDASGALRACSGNHLVRVERPEWMTMMSRARRLLDPPREPGRTRLSRSTENLAMNIASGKAVLSTCVPVSARLASDATTTQLSKCLPDSYLLQ